MRTHRPYHDRVLRVVMPMDTALSMVFVAAALVAAPALWLAHPSAGVVRAIGLACIASAVALAAMGAVTACALLYAMAHGRFDFPARLWLPLPRVSELFVEPAERSRGTRGDRSPGGEQPAA